MCYKENSKTNIVNYLFNNFQIAILSVAERHINYAIFIVCIVQCENMHWVIILGQRMFVLLCLICGSCCCIVASAHAIVNFGNVI